MIVKKKLLYLSGGFFDTNFWYFLLPYTHPRSIINYMKSTQMSATRKRRDHYIVGRIGGEIYTYVYIYIFTKNVKQSPASINLWLIFVLKRRDKSFSWVNFQTAQIFTGNLFRSFPEHESVKWCLISWSRSATDHRGAWRISRIFGRFSHTSDF